MKLLPILIGCILLLASCTHTRHVDTTAFKPDYFIFGTSYGMCRTDCTHLFRLADAQLYPDSMEHGLAPQYFSAIPLEAHKALMAEKLLASMPESLRKSVPERVIGCPDCHDQGTLYVEYAQGGKVSVIRMDTDTTAIPAAFGSFATQLQSTVANLR